MTLTDEDARRVGAAVAAALAPDCGPMTVRPEVAEIFGLFAEYRLQPPPLPVYGFGADYIELRAVFEAGGALALALWVNGQPEWRGTLRRSAAGGP